MEEQLPPTTCQIYEKSYSNLLRSLSLCRSGPEKLLLFTDFVEKYYLCQKDWEYGNSFLEEAINYNMYISFRCSSSWQEKRRITRYEKAQNISNHANLWYETDYPYYYQSICDMINELLIIPNPHLKRVLKYHQQFGGKPLSTKMKVKFELALKLTNASKNDDQWLDHLQESNNTAFVADLIEARLKNSQSFFNPKIWLFYIQFLRHQNNSKRLLSVYQRYCRLFISDIGMREEYRHELERNETEKEKKIVEYWIDLIKLQVHFGTFNVAYELLEKALNVILNLNICLARGLESDFMKDLECYTSKMRNEENWHPDFRAKHTIRKPKSSEHLPRYNFDTYPQYANLPAPMFRHILRRANAKILNKLHQICKFFFHLRPHPICHRLNIHYSYFTKELQFYEQSLFASYQMIPNFKNSNLIIGHSLIVDSTNPYVLSAVIQILKKCEARYLKICNQVITYKEFRMLISSKKLKTVILKNTQIMDDNNNRLPKLVLKAAIKFCGNKDLTCFFYC